MVTRPATEIRSPLAVHSDRELAATWPQTAADIKADILEHGVDERGVLRQHYDSDALAASTLLAAIFGFLPRDDPGFAPRCWRSPAT